MTKLKNRKNATRSHFGIERNLSEEAPDIQRLNADCRRHGRLKFCMDLPSYLGIRFWLLRLAYSTKPAKICMG